MALNEEQVAEVRDARLIAETYSFYFGDLVNRYGRTKQIITFVTFFVASGAAASILGKVVSWVSPFLCIVVALLSAYSVATGLDNKVKTMTKLHYSWLQISSEYTHLWHHTHEGDAEHHLADLNRREQDLVLIAIAEAPNDPKALTRWQAEVVKMHKLASA